MMTSPMDPLGLFRSLVLILNMRNLAAPFNRTTLNTLASLQIVLLKWEEIQLQNNDIYCSCAKVRIR